MASSGYIGSKEQDFLIIETAILYAMMLVPLILIFIFSMLKGIIYIKEYTMVKKIEVLSDQACHQINVEIGQEQLIEDMYQLIISF